jgi:hypothetical protein
MSLGALRSAFSPPGRTSVIGYIFIATAANAVWEAAQLPFYTIWRTASPSGLVYAVVHCTLGDLAILTAALLLALLMAGDDRWPVRGYARVALLASALGLSATVLSEWLNVEVWGRWTYAPGMPVLPPLGIGLSPLLQWLLIPPLGFWVARRWREI